MTVQKEIESLLQKQFSPTILTVTNNSHLHKGHAGDDGSGMTHFYIEIETPLFKKRTRLECHRMVYTILKHLINNPIHALEISIIQQP